MKGFKQRRAFTIVEMVIVIAVIAVLATVMIPTVSGVIDRANVSADQQLAASINKQLAVWEADPNNGTIDSEEQLRKAFEAYYDAGFIDKLAPKSGEQGYHYWYNATDKQFLLAKFEDLSKDRYTGAEADLDLFSEVFLLSTDGSVVPLAATDAYKFERNSPRSLIVTTESGRQVNFYLMDVEGSEFVRNLNNLLNESDSNSALATNIEIIKDIQNESALAEMIVGKLANTAVANKNGIFAPEGTTVTNVYVAPDTEKIGASNNVDLSGVTSIDLPKGTGVVTGALSNANVMIRVNTTEGELGSLFAAASIGQNAIIELPDGTQYKIEDTQIKNISTGEVVGTTDYSTQLTGFTVEYVGGNHADLHFYGNVEGSSNTLHITGDTTTVTLKASGFEDGTNKTVSRPVSWKKGETVLGTEKEVVIPAASLNNGDVITVVAQNVTYTINVVKVGITNFSAFLDQTDGEPFNADSGVVYEATLKYTKDSSWTIHPNVVAQTNCVTICKDVTPSLTVANNMVTLVDVTEGDQTLKALKMGANATGKFEATLTLTTVGKNSNGNPMTVTFKLKFEPAESAFTVADNANVYDKYGIDLTVGSKSTIDLGTLFALKAGKTVDASKINVKQFESEAAAIAFTGGNSIVIDKTDSNWENWTIQPTCSKDQQDVYLAIGDGGASFALKVKVAKDAYNIQSKSDWLNSAYQTRIVLLNDIVLGTDFNTASNTTSGKYKSITYMHGNYHVIDATQFMSRQYSGERFSGKLIAMGAGSKMECVVIDGPIYPENYGTTKVSDDSSYTAPGVLMTGGTIENCYISGFAAPVRVDGSNSGTANKVTLINSVLDGGVKCNLYCNWEVMEVTLKNMTLVQRAEKYQSNKFGTTKDVIGASVFIDTNANCTIKIEGTLDQYCWLGKDESYSGNVETIRSTIFDQSCNEYTYKNYLHTIGDKLYVNMGIAQQQPSILDGGTTYEPTISASAQGYAGTMSKALQSSTLVKVQLWTYDCDTSNDALNSNCTHALNPEDLTGEDGVKDGVYDYLDFIEGKKK